MSQLDDIRARAEAATAGPWIHNDRGHCCEGTCITCDGLGIYLHNLDDLDWHDAEFIAHARQDVPRLLAVLDAVLALHVPVAVYKYNDVDGVFDLDADGEPIKLYEVCGTCTPGDTLEALGDCEFTDDDPYTIYPCPTLNAITEALEAS